MAITKTNFINYSRCRRYSALEKIKKTKLNSDLSYEEYQEEQKYSNIEAIINMMYEVDEEGNEVDLVDFDDVALEAMMKYYKMVEVEAAKLVSKIFNGTTKHALNTKKQEAFDYNHKGIRYICYLDILNEKDDKINIIEVKASTSRGYLETLAGGYRSQNKYPIFHEVDGIMKLKDEINYNLENEMPIEEYNRKRNKLFDRYGIGKYVYDLAVQRMIIEGEYKETNQLSKINKTNYYLAVLNHEYIYNGKQENNEPLYDKDDQGNEIIRIFDFTKITEEYQSYVLNDQASIENYLFNPDSKPVKLGDYCEYKKRSECKFFKPVCTNHLPYNNSVLNYMGKISFKDEQGTKYNKLDLINDGYINLLDVPENWIQNYNNLKQREVVMSHKPYVHQEKIKFALKMLKYPLYHLDFETFPCPFPRFKNEKCYEQSPFEFSLHIEHEEGKCDKDKDNFVYLNKTHQDERKIIAQKLCELIDPNKGMMFAQNVSFERSVLKKLAKLYPEYREKLLKIVDNSFDLIDIIKGSKKIYEGFDFSDEEIQTVNYYHENLNGSYSIKKTLPVFTKLTYNDLIVKNGTEAYITYLKYPLFSEEEYKIKYQALIDYCKQDTWAMVEILDALRKLVKDERF